MAWQAVSGPWANANTWAWAWAATPAPNPNPRFPPLLPRPGPASTGPNVTGRVTLA